MQVRADILTPVIIYLLLIYVIGVYAYKYVKSAPKGFLVEFFAGSREVSGLVLAFTLVATYLSAGSFIGGPGVAYRLGYGWVLLAMTQLPTVWLTLGLLGKKFAIVARKINAVTVVDVVRERYGRNVIVTVVSAVSIVVFMIATMTAQTIGGATIFQSITGLDYTYGIVIFAVTVVIYTMIGGYRAVVLTDTLQGFVMLIGTIVLVAASVTAAGGVGNLTASLALVDEELITPYGPGGVLHPLWVSSFWVLVGIGVIGLPYVSVRALTYRDSKALHRGMIVGTALVGWLVLSMHLAGVFAAFYVPGLRRGDLAIPELTIKVLPSALAGVFLAAPLAAIMSTVDSQLLLASSAIVKDLYVNYVNPKVSSRRLRIVSLGSTLVLGAIAFIAAYKPPDLLVWINLFALGGLESVFLIPLVLGLYWRRGNVYGAVASMIVGLVAFIAIYAKYSSRFLNMYPVVFSIGLALVAYIVVSMLTPKPSKEVIRRFWGK